MSTPSGLTDAAAKAEGTREPASGSADKAALPSGRGSGPEALVGVVLGGRYMIERLIGEGGMGAVYQAEHMHMHKRMAVKVLHPEMSGLPEVVARFEREAMAAAHIEHPNVAAATDFGKLDDGSFFLVLEYVEGKSLREGMAAGPLELARALRIATQMAGALGRAHGLGIVHRDLKPENVMLVARDDEPDFVKILDFGIAKVPIGGFGGESKPPGQVLTQVGMVYGTPEYMAPEQALGQGVDARADLYALGVIMFEMVTGVRPYQHDSKVTLLGMHVTAPIPAMQERAPDIDVPSEFEGIVRRLLAKEAGERFSDAKALSDALESFAIRSLGPSRLRAAPSLSRLSQVAIEGRVGPESDVAPVEALGPTRLALPRSLASLGTVWSRIGPRLAAAVPLERWRDATAPRHVVLGASAGVGLVLLVSVWIVAGAARSAGVPRSGGAGAVSESWPRLVLRDTKTDEIVATARDHVEAGDYAAALDALSTVEKTNSARPDVHEGLERAYAGMRSWRDAMHEAGMLLVLDANAATDPRLQEDVRGAALLRESQDEAFSLLEAKMGPHGIDILYDLAYGAAGRTYPQAATRARRSLSIEEVRDRASSALAILLDFREAKTCDAKRALMPRVRDQADARMLAVLQSLQATRGCGFLGMIDCYPCLHRDAVLSEAMDAVQARAAKSP